MSLMGKIVFPRLQMPKSQKRISSKKQRIINEGVQLTLSLLISYISDSYIIPTSFVLPHILGDSANVYI